jgi:DHA2 family multidrug resistance protein
VTNIGWRWIFFINVPVGIAAVAMCASVLPEDGPPGKRTPVDWIAIALLAIGLGSLQVFLEEGYSEDWFDSTFITVTAISAVVALVLFVLRQLRSPHPVVDLRVLRYRSLWAGSILSVIVGMALYGALFAVPIFASTVLHYTARDIGLLMLPGALGSAFMMPVASALLKKFDPRVLLATGALILVTAVLWLGKLTSGTSSMDLFWPLLVRAFGTVLMFLPLSMATLGPIPKQDVGAATAFYNLTRQLGGSIGVALLTTILGVRAFFHYNVLLEHLPATDPNVQSRLTLLTASFAAKGADAVQAKQRAITMLDGAARLQGSVLAFNDTFFITAMLVLVAIPLVFILGKPGAGAKVASGAH